MRELLEERYWRPIEESSKLGALGDGGLLTERYDVHPALFADHGIAHVRNVAAGVVDLAALAAGPLLPPRPEDRQQFVVGLAVMLAYLHDVGMDDTTPEGRHLHAVVAAHVAFSDAFDDVLDLIVADDGPVVRRIAVVDRAAPFPVPARTVLRELLSLAVGHSKSTVPSGAFADPHALRLLMRGVVLVDLEHHRRAVAPGDGARATIDGPSRNEERYADGARDAFAWLDSGTVEHRKLAEDAVDAVRLVRAADALRQRGTTLRTAAGYEIFVDAATGDAVFALRPEGGERLLLLRVDSPLSAGQANLRYAVVTASGHLRFAFHQGRFPDPRASSSACVATARVVADIASDVVSAFADRPAASTLPPPGVLHDPMRVELERPVDDPAFADAVASELAARDPALGARAAVVADLTHATEAERTRYHEAVRIPAGSDEACLILDALGAHGAKIDAIDREQAFEDVRRCSVEAGDVLVAAGSEPAFVYVPLGHGLRVEPLGGYAGAEMAPWVPVGVTGVVRRAERNSTVVASATVEVLMIPGELYAREWFRPYDLGEIQALLRAGGSL